MKHPSTLLITGLITILSASSLFADSGGLTDETIDQIRSSFKMDSHTRAMYNAITNSDITSLALNRDILRHHNEIFSHEIGAKDLVVMS